MTDGRTPQEQIADGYAKAAFDVPYDRDLESMADKTIDVELEKSKEGSARRSALEREKERRKTSEYPGGPTWVDREYDPYFMELPPDEKFRRLKAVGRWLKEHVLAAVIIFVLTTILGIYIKQWLSPPQVQSPPPIQEPKAMPV